MSCRVTNFRRVFSGFARLMSGTAGTTCEVATTSISTSSSVITEGKATIYFSSEKGVFYNPPQIQNRDLSVLVLHEFARIWETEMLAKAAKASRGPANRQQTSDACERAVGAGDSATNYGGKEDGSVDVPLRLRVLDAMTASGLRAIRYVREVPLVGTVTANDVEPAALDALRENLRRNGLSEEQVIPNLGDAVSVMHSSKPPEGRRYDVVELDPYGTVESRVAHPFHGPLLPCHISSFPPFLPVPLHSALLASFRVRPTEPRACKGSCEV